MSISDRISLIMKSQKLTNKQLAEWLDVSPTRVGQKFSDDVWDSIDELKTIARHTGYALDAIITGKGFSVEKSKILALKDVVTQVQEPQTQLSRRIPFYDIEATGGLNGGDVSPVSHPTATIDIGDILRDSEAAIRMAGNSMMPGYPPGCVLGLIAKKNKNIIPGEVYVYEDEDGRHCKRLFYKDDDPTSDTYICYSDSTLRFESGPRKDKLFYPPYELKMADIVRMFTVTGVVKRNTNGAINYKRPQ